MSKENKIIGRPDFIESRRGHPNFRSATRGRTPELPIPTLEDFGRVYKKMIERVSSHIL